MVAVLASFFVIHKMNYAEIEVNAYQSPRVDAVAYQVALAEAVIVKFLFSHSSLFLLSISCSIDCSIDCRLHRLTLMHCGSLTAFVFLVCYSVAAALLVKLVAKLLFVPLYGGGSLREEGA